MESDPIDLDLYSRKVVGWAMGAKADTALHQAALSMAITQRQPQAGLIHHTDRGRIARHMYVVYIGTGRDFAG